MEHAKAATRAEQRAPVSKSDRQDLLRISSTYLEGLQDMIPFSDATRKYATARVP